MHIFLITLALIGYVAANENPEAVASLKAKAGESVQIEQNTETGLTDFSLFGKEFSLEVQPLDVNKLND